MTAGKRALVRITTPSEELRIIALKSPILVRGVDEVNA
jgi:hypothetical protein